LLYDTLIITVVPLERGGNEPL